MGYGFDGSGNGLPDLEGRERLRRAILVGNEHKDLYTVYMVLAGGKPEVARRYGARTLSHSARVYLERSRYWKWNRILLHPLGRDTPTELIAAKVAIKESGGGTPHAVSSWWHVPRVYITGVIIFGPRFKVSASGTTLRGHELRHEIWNEAKKIIPSIFHTIWTRLTFRPQSGSKLAAV